APRGIESPNDSFLRFAEIQKIEAKGDRVVANSVCIYRAASPAEARRVVELVRSITKLPQNQRAAAIEKELKKHFDAKAIRNRYDEFEEAARWPTTLANLLFLLLFFTVPLYIVMGVVTLAWIGLITITLIAIAATARSFVRAHRNLYPEESESRWSDTLTVALSPFAAIRVRDMLARPLLASFDPVAIASLLLPSAAFQQLAAREYRGLRFPRVTTGASDSIQKERLWFEQTWNRILENFLKKNIDDLEAFLKAPFASSRESRSFCPRCHTQFRLEAGECSDCTGIALQPFPETRHLAN
ncbi:MAG: hypothetical protein HY046_12880, partial [Acidobacteria bacterium]|nr:hypothetical protein [Acidobacteriota bacterium]